MTAQMIDVGKQIRYNRIVSPETGKTVIVPLDHGIILGPVAGIEDPAETVRKVVAGGASAVIFNTGLAPSIYSAYMNRCGAICNLINSITAASELTLISSVENAIRSGADAVSVQVLVGSPHERHMLNNARIVADQCARWSMPLLAMMYPTDEALAKMGTEVELLAARAGAELGADIVKVSYTGDQDSFQALVDACPRPVVIAGGPKKETIRAALEMVEDAIACGAAGVALGRNVWQNPDPVRMTAALVDIIQHGKKVAELQLPAAWL
ncbi:MAG: 2-amino-3,7-dideoxy-D-threo-hept-6-ulosonate synthase [Caldilineaceae bacterium]|nr:2-amino-3,7-dideoxy-D-threo-hept-6-ulosonate synthase [Caldilineaceae bacterium]